MERVRVLRPWEAAIENVMRGRDGTARIAPQFRRCAVYTRKSTSAGLEQEFNTLHAQREVCERYIQSQVGNGWVVLPQQYDDGGFTGANLDRPAFHNLLADAEDGKIDIVVVYKVDRLSRSLLDFATVMDRFTNISVDFVSVTQNFSTADAMGRLTMNMLMSFSEYEREMITERTRDKIAAARRRGKWTGGSVPLGYEVVDKKLVVKPDEAATVRLLFDIYLERRSVIATAHELNARGLTVKRHEALDGKVRGGGKWHKNAVLTILRSPPFAGYMPHGENLFEGEHAAIVSREIFHRAQVIRERWSNRAPGRGRNPAYILRSVLRCACGGALTPASTRREHRVYRYYRCVTRDKHGRDRCAAREVSAETIEEFVVDRVRDAQAGGALQDAFEHRLSRMRGQMDGTTATRGSMQAELDSGSSNDSGDSLRMNLYQTDLRIAELDQAIIDIEWAMQVLQDFEPAWELLSDENRARLIRALIHRVTIDDTDGIVTVEMTDASADPPTPPEPADTGATS